MEIQKQRSGSVMKIALSGRLDTGTAPRLEAEVRDLTGITGLHFDFTDLVYISSAGLRIILTCQKTMKRQGEMTISHVCPDIMEIFDITGFSDILTIL